MYLHYKLAEDANKAYSTYKKDPVQIGETTIKITKLTPDDKTKDKKRNQTSKKGKNGGVIRLFRFITVNSISGHLLIVLI